MLRLWYQLCKLHFGKTAYVGECKLMRGMPLDLLCSCCMLSLSQNSLPTFLTQRLYLFLAQIMPIGYCLHTNRTSNARIDLVHSTIGGMPRQTHRSLARDDFLNGPFLLPMLAGTLLQKQLFQKHLWAQWPSVTDHKLLWVPWKQRAKGRLPHLPLLTHSDASHCSICSLNTTTLLKNDSNPTSSK